MSHPISRREFLKNLGIAGSGMLLCTSPWLSAFSDVTYTHTEKCRLAVIGTGVRGRFLMHLLQRNPKVEITALCDIYRNSMAEGVKLAPNAKIYGNYREVLENKNVDAVIIATPLSTHCSIAVDAFEAGKHVFCESATGFTPEECLSMYRKHQSSGRVFFTGHQRFFNPRYIKAMEMIHSGTFGTISAIRTFSYCNESWTLPVPSPGLKQVINWRLYRNFSKGLMSEFACHQLQVGTWALRKLPERIMGHGATTCKKDGREIYDNVSCIYVFDDGVKMTFDSIMTNRFYGTEEQIMGTLGTVELEKGKYYLEHTEPEPAILQLMNEWENKLSDFLSLDSQEEFLTVNNRDKGKYILQKHPRTDGTSLMTEAFIEAVITGKQPPQIAEEGYYADILCLLGHQAMEKEQTIIMPNELKLNDPSLLSTNILS